jgi:hypothetical protein
MANDAIPSTTWRGDAVTLHDLECAQAANRPRDCPPVATPAQSPTVQAPPPPPAPKPPDAIATTQQPPSSKPPIGDSTLEVGYIGLVFAAVLLVFAVWIRSLSRRVGRLEIMIEAANLPISDKPQ